MSLSYKLNTKNYIYSRHSRLLRLRKVRMVGDRIKSKRDKYSQYTVTQIGQYRQVAIVCVLNATLYISNYDRITAVLHKVINLTDSCHSCAVIQ